MGKTTRIHVNFQPWLLLNVFLAARAYFKGVGEFAIKYRKTAMTARWRDDVVGDGSGGWEKILKIRNEKWGFPH